METTDLVITSTDRTGSETIYNFTNTFNRINNVFKIELLSVVLPNVGNVNLEPMIRVTLSGHNADKQDFEKVQQGFNGQQATWILQPESNNTSDSFIKPDIMSSTTLNFQQYLSLDYLRIQLSDYLYEPFDFNGLSNTTDKEHTFYMIIRVYSKSFTIT